MTVDIGEMLYDSRCISIQINARGSRALMEEGLTDVQARVLVYIMAHSEQGVSLTDIHRDMSFSMAAASGLIKRLREKGYVRVVPCRLDERKKLLYATEKCAGVRAAMDAMLRHIRESLCRGFTEEELSELNRLQKKMLRNLGEPDKSNLEG